MSLATVRAGLKDALDTISTLTVYGYLTLYPHTPAAIVGFPDELDPHPVLGAGVDYRIDVALFVGLTDDAIADVTLTVLIDQVIAAVELDPTLGGVCMSTTVVRVGDFGQSPLGDGGPQALGCLVNVEVMQ